MMPKLFGSAVSGLAVVVLATGLVGCRTGATQLASVPGLGWLDRGDEGWANYEPAPGLPKPSATNEPTSGGPASGIAETKKADSPFSNPIGNVAKGTSKSRFDTDRYVPKKDDAEPKEKAPSFGNYASAYGKFVPPKMDKGSSTRGLAAQEGPYSVEDKTPKFASTDTTKDFTTDTKAPSFGPAISGDDTKKPEFTANATSRFGAPAFDKPKAATSTASTSGTYTPPGFPAKADAVASRFDAATSTTKSRFDQANRFANDTTSALNDSAANTLDKGQQTFNRFANDATTKATTTVANATNSAVNAGTQAFNRFANQPTATSQPAPAENRFSNAVETARNQLNNLPNAAKPSGNTFGGQTPSSFADTAKQTFNNAANTAQTTVNNAVNNTMNNVVAGAKDYAAGYQNAAAGAVNDVKNRLGNVAPPQTPSFGNTAQNVAQNVTQGVTQQVQNYAQGAVNAVEQGVASQYQQAKTAATNYANSAMNTATQRANGIVNSATNAASQQPQQPVVAAAQNMLNNASNGLNQATTTVQSYANAGQAAANNVMQNVSNAGQAAPVQYPSTSTPNPFMNPPRVLPPATRSTTVTPPPGAPNYNNAPNFGAPLNTPSPTIQRDSTPFRPGSTKSFQGATTVRKQEIELTSTTTPTREPLVLAVGDAQQFPRMLR